MGQSRQLRLTTCMPNKQETLRSVASNKGSAAHAWKRYAQMRYPPSVHRPSAGSWRHMCSPLHGSGIECSQPLTHLWVMQLCLGWHALALARAVAAL